MQISLWLLETLVGCERSGGFGKRFLAGDSSTLLTVLIVSVSQGGGCGGAYLHLAFVGSMLPSGCSREGMGYQSASVLLLVNALATATCS